VADGDVQRDIAEVLPLLWTLVLGNPPLAARSSALVRLRVLLARSARFGVVLSFVMVLPV
jgi:hypothetical protein